MVGPLLRFDKRRIAVPRFRSNRRGSYSLIVFPLLLARNRLIPLPDQPLQALPRVFHIGKERKVACIEPIYPLGERRGIDRFGHARADVLLRRQRAFHRRAREAETGEYRAETGRELPFHPETS